MDAERLLGQLEAQYQEIHRRLLSLEEKIDSQRLFNGKLVGVIMTLSALCSVVVTVVVEYLR
jgi:hypothetical protein